MTVPVWMTFLAAFPVLWIGETLIQRIRVLARLAIPAPVAGGLLVAVLLLFPDWAGWPVRFESATAARFWTWLTTAEPEWIHAPAKNAALPFLAVFFAGVGLSASWSLVRRAGRQVLWFLLAVSVMAVLQNVLAVALAPVLGLPALFGLVCGSMSLTGGHATTLGFAAELEQAGLAGAQVLGTAAATVGLVSGALLSGPVASGLVRRHALRSSGQTAHEGEVRPTAPAAPGPVGAWASASLLLLACVKGGAWISFGLQRTGLVFPVFIGTLITGVLVRFILDRLRPHAYVPAIGERVGSLALALFLAMTMMTLNLRELADAAGPMLAILSVQLVLMAAFAWWVTFPLMGRDYDAAIMAGGHCGFGLGSTTTAVAGMKAVVEARGPAPRAFLVVPLVGGFLVDLFNSANLTAFISLASRP